MLMFPLKILKKFGFFIKCSCHIKFTPLCRVYLGSGGVLVRVVASYGFDLIYELRDQYGTGCWVPVNISIRY